MTRENLISSLRMAANGLVPLAEARLLRQAADEIESLIRENAEARPEKPTVSRCGLCVVEGEGINSHGDCAFCAKAQYVD